MYIKNCTSTTFTGCYDMHTHTGHWWNSVPNEVNGSIKLPSGMYAVLKDYGQVDTFEMANKLLDSSDDKIDKMFVSNLDCLLRNNPDMSKSTITNNGTPFIQDEYSGNLELLNKYKNNENYVLYATCQPSYGNVKNVERILDEGSEKFVGLKFHPKQLDLRADNSAYDEYLNLAEKRSLPCLFHSQVNIDYSSGIGKVVENVDLWETSDPEFIYNLAKRHPNVPIIMGHTGAGGELAHNKAIDVLIRSIENNDAKLYCDISWLDFENGLPQEDSKTLVSLLTRLKEKQALDRVMFGSDAPLGCYGEAPSKYSPSYAYKMTIDNIKKTIRKHFADDAENIINKVFYENAHNLFFDNGNALTSAIQKNNNKGKVFALSALLLGVFGIAYSFMHNSRKLNSITQKE